MEEMNKKIIQADLKLEELKDKAREWDILAKENLELRKEIERLNNIKKEAIEYIEQLLGFVISSNIEKREYKRFEYVLELLKGSDKE